MWRTSLALLALAAALSCEPEATFPVQPPRIEVKQAPEGQGADLETSPLSLPIECAHLQPLNVGGSVLAPKVIKRVDPKYPYAIRRLRISGVAVLELVIDTNGDVCAVRVIKGIDPTWDKSFVEAMKHWKFDPATVNGKPVDSIFKITVNIKPQ